MKVVFAPARISQESGGIRGRATEPGAECAGWIRQGYFTVSVKVPLPEELVEYQVSTAMKYLPDLVGVILIVSVPPERSRRRLSPHGSNYSTGSTPGN